MTEDFDGDGKKELITLGEHYHSAFIDAPEGAQESLAKLVFKDLGYLENRDYNNWGAKLIRYYSNDNGRYHDITKEKIKNLSINGNSFVSVFGHATGDIDNDGDLDLVVSAQTTEGRMLNVLLNDGKGFLTGSFYNEDRNGFSTTFREIKSDLLATRLPCRDAIFSAVDRNSSIFCALSIIFVMSRFYYFIIAAAGN